MSSFENLPPGRRAGEGGYVFIFPRQIPPDYDIFWCTHSLQHGKTVDTFT